MASRHLSGFSSGEKLKVLFVSHSAFLNGAETSLLSLLSNLDRNEFEPVLVIPCEGELGKKVRSMGITVYIANQEWWVEGCYSITGNVSLHNRVTDLLAIIDIENPDIVHTNTSVVIEGAIAAAIRGIPHIWHIHEILDNHPRLRPILPHKITYSIMSKLSERIAVVSRAVRDQLTEVIPMDKMEIIYNGVDTNRFRPNLDSDIRDELGLQSEDVLAVAVGSVIKEKGYDNLLAAAALLKARGTRVLTAIVGQGEAEGVQELLASITTLGLKSHVKYLGYRTDIPEILSATDIYILPSVTDAFPFVVLEAMSMGKPIVATKCGGPSEMLVDGESGFLVETNDPEALAAKIELLAKDPELQARMGKSAIRRVKSRFSLETFVSRFSSAYRQLALSSKLPLDKNGLLAPMMELYQKHVVAETFRKEGQANKELIHNLQQIVAEKNEIIIQNEARIRELELRNSELISSLSWRITAPARGAAAFLLDTKKYFTNCHDDDK